MDKKELGITFGIFAIITYTFYGFFYYFLLASKLLLINNLLTAIFCTWLVYVLKTNVISYKLYSHLVVVATVLALTIINIVLGGVNSPMNYWFISIIIASGFMLGTKCMIFWGSLVSGLYLASYILKENPILTHFDIQLTNEQYQILHISSLIGVVILSSMFAWSYIITNERYKEKKIESFNRINFLLKILNHDLANPITVMSLYVKKLKKKHDDPLLEKLELANSNIIEILNSVRAIDRFYNMEVINLNNINLNELVTSSVSEISEMFTEKRIHVIIDIDPSVTVKVDENIFKNQVIKNLLTNAFKFSQSGDEIHLSYLNDILIVKDMGIGIPETEITNIFNYGSSTSRRGTLGEKGTGFGLPIVKECCDKMGIGIDILTTIKEGQSGTSFLLSFNQS